MKKFNLTLTHELILITMETTPRCGVEIVDLLKHSTDGAKTISANNIYNYLHRLEDRGFIKQIGTYDGRLIYYKITNDGIEALKDTRNLRRAVSAYCNCN